MQIHENKPKVSRNLLKAMKSPFTYLRTIRLQIIKNPNNKLQLMLVKTHYFTNLFVEITSKFKNLEMPSMKIL